MPQPPKLQLVVFAVTSRLSIALGGHFGGGALGPGYGNRQTLVVTPLGHLDAAVEHARRLAEMEPFDMDAQRMILDLCIRQGRRSEAFRRYSVLRKRMQQSFGQEPDFDLAELEDQSGA